MSAAMLAAGVVLAEGASDGGGFTPSSVTPGVPGFLVVFLLGLATLLLILDMTRRIRRMQARERVAERHRLADEADTEDSGVAPGDPVERSAGSEAPRDDAALSDGEAGIDDPRADEHRPES